MDTSKEIKDILGQMSTEEIVESFNDMSKSVSMWQSKFNEVSEEVENLTDEKRLKVKVDNVDDRIISTLTSYIYHKE